MRTITLLVFAVSLLGQSAQSQNVTLFGPQTMLGGGNATPTVLPTHAPATGTSSSASVTVNTTGATLIVVAASYSQGGCTGPTLTVTTPSVTLTGLVAYGGSGSGSTGQIFYFYSPSTGTAQVFTLAGSGCLPSMDVLPISGTFVGTVEGTNGFAQTGTATTIQAGTTGTLSAPNQEICIFNHSFGVLISGWSINTSFTELDFTNINSGITFGDVAAYLVPSATTALNPTASWTTASGGAAGIACFK